MLLGLGEGADDCYLNSQGREKCQLLMAYHYVTKPDSFSAASKSVAGETFVQNTVTVSYTHLTLPTILLV